MAGVGDHGPLDQGARFKVCPNCHKDTPVYPKGKNYGKERSGTGCLWCREAITYNRLGMLVLSPSGPLPPTKFKDKFKDGP